MRSSTPDALHHRNLLRRLDMAQCVSDYSVTNRAIVRVMSVRSPRHEMRNELETAVTARLQDKVAILTGAASGIGEAVARRYLDEGARCVLVDVKPADSFGAVRQPVLNASAVESAASG